MISLLSIGLSRVLSSTTVQKHQFFGAQRLYCPTSYLYMTTGKSIALTIWTFVSKVMSLFLNMLSRFVIVFLPRSNQATFNFMAAVTVFSDLGIQENVSLLPLFPLLFAMSDGTRCHDLSFLNVEF